MKTIPILLTMFITGGVALAQQPKVSAVVNAASNAVSGLPNSAIAQGAMFIAYGTNLGPASIVQVSSFPLPTTLSGTSVKVTVNGTSVDAIMVYTLATQIAAVLPSSTPTGTGTIVVTYNGQASATAPITVVSNNFGTFSVNQAGSGTGIITYADYSLVTPNKAANPGETLLIWGTGLGPVSGNEAAGPLPGDLGNVPVELYIGGKQATVTYRGRSGCCTGLDQIAFVVPSGVASCNVPVAVKIGNEVSNFTNMAVAATGRVCTDPSGSSGTDYVNLFNQGTASIGSVSLSRTNSISSGIGGIGGGTTKSDDGSAIFYKFSVTPGQFPASLIESVNFGACSVSSFTGQTANPFGSISITGLDAGPSISVNGPSGSRTLAKMQSANSPTIYSAKLGDTTAGNYLDAGAYTLAGPGGADVGMFSVPLTVPAPLVWNEQASITSVNRASGLPVSWSGGSPSAFVNITGSSFSISATNSAVGVSFTCLARVSDGSFTVPPVVLLSLPASSSVGGFAIPGSLSVGTSTAPVVFKASGLDYAIASWSDTNSKSVSYQ